MFSIIGIGNVFGLLEDLMVDFGHRIGVKIDGFGFDFAVVVSVSFRVKFGVLLLNVFVRRGGSMYKGEFYRVLIPDAGAKLDYFRP